MNYQLSLKTSLKASLKVGLKTDRTGIDPELCESIQYLLAVALIEFMFFRDYSTPLVLYFAPNGFRYKNKNDLLY
jgi:hypothetical protein